MRTIAASLVLSSGVAWTSPASAHLTLTSPPARHPNSDLKFGPCGVESGDARSTDPAKITTYTAGEVITVEWTEVVDHDPSHYRIAFSYEGDDFADPTGFDDTETVYPELLDGIPDADGGSGYEYSVEVTLPNEPCELCSLQVIQVMHDKPPWGPGGGDDIYYQCADIILLEDPNNPPDPVDPLPTGNGGSPGMEGAGGMTATGGMPASGGAPGTGGDGILMETGGDAGIPSAGGGPSAPQAAGGSWGTGGEATDSSTTAEGDGTQAGCSLAPSGQRPGLGWLSLGAALVLLLRRRSAQN